MILIIYVDDIILTRDNLVEKRLKKSLAIKFEVRDLGQIHYFLGMEIARSKRGISVSQWKYVLYLSIETSMLKSKLSNTPFEGGKKVENNGKPIEKDKHRRLVGKLFYLSHIKPYIVFVV